jgi:uncharacterized protein YegL
MISKRLVPFISLLLLLSIVLVACGGDSIDSEVQPTEKPVSETEETPGEDVSAIGSKGAGDAPVPPPDTGVKVEVTRVVTEVEVVVEESRSGVAADAELAEPVVSTASPLATPPAAGEGAERVDAMTSELTLNQNSRLTAGEVNDNDDWDEYLLYMRNYGGAAVIRVDVSERHQIWVTDSQSNPLLGARIGIEANGQEVAVLRTHSDGRAFFFPKALDLQADSYTVNVAVKDVTESFVIPSGGPQREWFVTNRGADQVIPAARLDVLFLIDATGSMADEINQLKENIRAIAAQIDALPAQPDVRFGLVTYRDRGDEFVTRAADFTPDVEQFADILSGVYADGGGDYPEDLNEALSRAVHGPEWRVQDTVSLIFLVADAPPHLDYGQENHYAVEMLEATERGIKIFPIASSGLDSQGEYIFRQLAQVTGGRFIFLTYGSEGPGSTGTETDFEVSDYTVSSLDTLVVKIVEEELSFLSR